MENLITFLPHDSIFSSIASFRFNKLSRFYFWYRFEISLHIDRWSNYKETAFLSRERKKQMPATITKVARKQFYCFCCNLSIDRNGISIALHCSAENELLACSHVIFNTLTNTHTLIKTNNNYRFRWEFSIISLIARLRNRENAKILNYPDIIGIAIFFFEEQ